VGALANLYRAIHSCNDDDIIVTVDGDDWLENPHVLQKINTAYQNPDIWLTYGQFKVYPGHNPGICKPYPKDVIAQKRYRGEVFVASHLRTFYAFLFKQIKLEDLLYKGSFLPVAWDLAFMFPMLEMAGNRFTCIQDVLYVYNRMNSLNDSKLHELLQWNLDLFIRSKPVYQELVTKPQSIIMRSYEKQAAIVLFSHDNPNKLEILLKDIANKISGIGSIIVVYTPSIYTWKSDYQKYDRLYDVVKKRFPQVTFLKQQPDNRTSMSSLLATCLSAISEKFILLGTDTLTIQEQIDITQCARLLESTGAYGFYLSVGFSSISTAAIELQENIYAWQFERTPELNTIQKNLCLTLYRKEDLCELYSNSHYYCAENIQDLWAQRIDTAKVGLCFTTAKVKGNEHA
jgi:glycosyltransferase involved in cell wall biosynthesis